MSDSIYSAPESGLSESAVEVEYHLASTGQRFLTFIIDIIGDLIFSVIFGVVLGLLGAFDMVENINEYVFGYAMMFSYFLVQEALWGRTVGKLITRTKVLNFTGGKPSFGQIVGRSLTRFVPFEAFSFFGGHGRPRGWHDSWSGTKVVSLKDIKDIEA